MDPWTMESLLSEYHVLFHHLLPVIRESIKFLSYSLRSVKIQELQGQVDRMLRKGALEKVENPRVGFYSRMFIVQKVSGG